MSQQADGLKPSDRHAEEEEHDMQCNKPHEKAKSYAFISSKSNSSSNNIIVNAPHHNSFIDDDLVTWLQYPLDDGAACHDIFQHWPSPPPSPSPALDHFHASSLLKNPPHQQNEALMLSTAPHKPLKACEGSVSVATDRHPVTRLTQASPSEGRIMQEVLQQRFGEAQQHNDHLIKHGNEAASSAALGAVSRQATSGEGLGAAKDCGTLSQFKLLPQKGERRWAAKEAHLGTNAETYSRHMDKRIVEADKDVANDWGQQTQLKHQPHDEGLAYLNVAGSLSDNSLSKEASVDYQHRNGKSLLDNDASKQLSATTSNAQANPAADAALALGAGRAAGVIRPLGVEAFSKVRTSLQSIRPSKLGSSPAMYTLSPTLPSGTYTSYPTGYSPPVLTPRGRAFGLHDYAVSGQPAKQTLQNAAQPYWFRPCANFASMGSQEHQFKHPLIRDVGNGSKSSHLVSSTTGLLGSQGTEELSAGLKQVACAEQAKDIAASSSSAATYSMDALDMQKPSGLPLPYRDRKDDVFSGGSETSESFKETFSGSKRKLDDSECQSEDAEGDSTVNSQARSSNSKRTRANEVHNLSERRRRNRINDKMNALRELIPNATKSNKAALLDEAIDYLKNLQLQLQVMSLRTGVSLSPMVLPPGLPHMQMPPIYPMGIEMTGGCSSEMGLVGAGAGSTVGVALCDMTYGVPAGPLTSLTSPNPMILQSPANNSNIEPRVMCAHESASSQFPRPFVHPPSQPPFPVNMDVYNSYVQHQQLQQQLCHQEQLDSPQVQPSRQRPPLSQQRPHYQQIRD